MTMHNNTAEWFVPDNIELDKAVARTTHLAVGAHQDDLEIMAHDGILKCFGQKDRWFTGVVVTNGAGSPRDDLYAAYSDEEMQAVRRSEQKKAAYIGEYAALAMLDFSSGEVKDPGNYDVVEDILTIIKAAQPAVIYTHNLADKHDTHLSVALRTIQAVRKLPVSERPKNMYGCEVWRSLDWMPDDRRIQFDVGAHPNVAAALVGVFDSQICGGKRYDKATEGRRIANATYADSHQTDSSQAVILAMDLAPLITDDTLNVAEYVAEYIDAFSNDVRAKLEKFGC